MNETLVRQFFQLAGQASDQSVADAPAELKELAAQLLLSETLEYVIKGLGVQVSFNGTKITDPNGVDYKSVAQPDRLEMLDGLADVAYTMYWNNIAFGQKLEEAFALVADNNLEKFVLLPNWSPELSENLGAELQKSQWGLSEYSGLAQAIEWPESVTSVSVLKALDGKFYAVGKDQSGKVRKPSVYQSVELSALLT